MEICAPMPAAGGDVIGVLSLYKSAEAIHKSVMEINHRVWLIAVGSGFLLYLSLFWIFYKTHKKQKRMEDNLKDLNAKMSLSGAITSRNGGERREAEMALEDALKWILRAARVDVARGYVMEEDNQELRLVSYEKSLEAALLDIPETPSAFLLDALKKGRTITSVPPAGLQGCLIIPLSHHERILGAIEILSLKRLSYSEEFFDSIGSQVGMALENANLFSQLKEINDRLGRRVDERQSPLI